VSELALHDQINELRRQRDAHQMDESDYTEAILQLIYAERAKTIAEVTEIIGEDDDRDTFAHNACKYSVSCYFNQSHKR